MTNEKPKKKSFSRKTSTLPTRVYKFALRPPTLNAELVDQSFRESRIYYNRLVTIENIRRQRYREARSRLFPLLLIAEAKVANLKDEIEKVRTTIKQTKSATRTRKVDCGSIIFRGCARTKKLASMHLTTPRPDAPQRTAS